MRVILQPKVPLTVLLKHAGINENARGWVTFVDAKGIGAAEKIGGVPSTDAELRSRKIRRFRFESCLSV